MSLRNLSFNDLWLVLVTLLILSIPPAVQADLVKLLNGGEVRGKILQTRESKQTIRVETITGALVVLERDQTQFVTMRSQPLEEYETRARHVDDTWEAHWELAEWCRHKSLSKQREAQLFRVIELNPQHEKAQTGLGRVWHQGNWVDRDELMASQGYVKHKGKYITRQELEVIESSAEELKLERNWIPKIRLWVAWLDNPDPARSQQGMAELKALDDPHAAPAVLRFLSSDPRVAVRELSVTILIKISGNKAIAGLVQMALFDEIADVRAAALDGIGHDYYEQAQIYFLRSLTSEYNTVVCRAANALGQIGDRKAISPLIEALVTVHQYQVPMEVQNNQVYSFNTNGTFASNYPQLPPDVMAAMRTGHINPVITSYNETPSKKLVPIRVEHFNRQVLEALEKLTGKDFGYDKRTWSLWWSAEKNHGGKLAKPEMP